MSEKNQNKLNQSVQVEQSSSAMIKICRKKVTEQQFKKKYIKIEIKKFLEF